MWRKEDKRGVEWTGVERVEKRIRMVGWWLASILTGSSTKIDFLVGVLEPPSGQKFLHMEVIMVRL